MSRVSAQAVEKPVRRRLPQDLDGDDAAKIAPSGKLVGAVTGAVKILRYLSNAREPVGVSRIAKDTKVNTSTCFNILRTLAVEDLVTFDPLSKTYSISLGIMELARGATALGGDLSVVRPLMERIANARNVTLTLWQPVSASRKVLVYSALARSAMRIHMAIGQRMPLFIGATGRLFAAFTDISERELETRFREINWNLPLTFDEFRKQVEEARESGWARDDGNFAAGTMSIAVPILDRDGVAVMAVTATMFAGHYSDDSLPELVNDLREVAAYVARVIEH
ncbi:IclR family transcriptional regulator [Aquamicrobium sp. LC103]|uniref:IclR family transcriptional regulator n=1 Tax=Aquamicrobium sp. LC103 TaxID=1120658 RepID=UPI000A5AC283|nr:IclR family transcriptional regulator [Aquamicrobium sp. LC103]